MTKELPLSLGIDITNEIVKAADKASLVRIMHERILPLFGIENLELFIINDKDNYHYSLTGFNHDVDKGVVGQQANIRLTPLKKAHRNTIIDEHFKELRKKQHPVVFDFSKAFKEYLNPLNENILTEGYKETFGALLQTNQEPFGILYLNSKQKGELKKIDATFYQQVAALIASVLGNILEKDEIFERAQEKDILLNISDQLSSLKTADELLQTIIKEVKPIFNFYDTGILLIDQPSNTYADLSVIYPQIDDSDINHYLHSRGYYQHHFIDVENSVVEWLLQQFNQLKEPLIFDYLKDYSAYSDANLLADIKNAGYYKAWMCPLVQQGNIFGILSLNFKSDQIPTEKLQLFSALSDRISSGLSNILANEEILKREKEKGQLLDISEAIATVQNSRQLLKVIYEKIKPAFEYDNAGLFILNKEGDSCYEMTDFEVSTDEVQREIQEGNLLGPFTMTGFTKDFWFNYKGPAITTIQQQAFFVTAPEGVAQLGIADAHGLKDLIGGPLNCGGKKIGMLCFSIKKENFYNEKHIGLFRSISDLIAIAVANILANEEIWESEKEKTLLLNISNSIAQINNKVALLKSINKLLWPIFHHDDAGFCIVDKEKKKFTDYYNLYAREITHNEESYYLNSVVYEQIYNVDDSTLPYPNSLVECYMNKPAEMGKLEDALPLNLNTDLLKLEIAHGLVYYICSPLTVSGRTLGMFNLLFKEENKPVPNSLNLFARISEIMALAFSNILAHEEIVEREKEKSQLLEISEAIATVQNDKQLLKVIYEKIQPVFEYDSAGLFILDKEAQNCYEITDNEVLPDAVQDEITKRNLLGPFTMSEFTKDFWFNYEKPTITTIKQQAEYVYHSAGKAQFEIGIANGLKDFICGPLNCGGRKIGMLCFSSKSENFYTEKHLGVFKSVSDLIAVAVANVLANEEILEREKEKTQLLAISEKLSTIRDKKGLFNAIFQQVSGIFNFDTATVAFYDTTLEYTKHFQTAYDEDYRHNENYQVIMSEKVPTKGNPHGEFIHFKTPQIISLDYFNEKYPGHVGVKIMNDFKLQECVILPLRYGNKLLATFEMHSKTKGTYDDNSIALYENLANQLAVAVANILANEEILEREKEKTILLEITELIAQVKNRDELLRLIVAKVKPIFNFHDCGLFIISKDGKTHSDLAAILPDVSVSEWNDHIQTVSITIPHNNSPVEWMIDQIDHAAQPVLCDFKNLVEKFPDYPQFSGFDILEMGYRDCLSTNLRVGGGIIGMFCINALSKNFFSPACFSIFQSVGDTIAIAMANILANEEIQLENKNKEILLSISEHIAGINNRKELFSVIIKDITSIIPIDDTGIIILNKEGTMWQDWTNTDNYQDTETVKELQQNKLTGFNEMDPMIKRSFSETGILNIEDYLSAGNAFASVMYASGLKEFMFTPLVSQGKTIGCLFFDSKTYGTYTEAYFNTFKSIANMVASAVANILANEEIMEETRNKDVLLSISKHIAAINNRKELFSIIINEVQSIIPVDDTAIVVLNKEGTMWQDWTNIDNYQDTSTARELQLNDFTAFIPMDPLTEKSFAETAILNITDYLKANHPFAQIMYDNGLEEFMFTPLIAQGRTIGSIYFDSKKSGTYSEKYFNTFKSIANMIASAVANILASEEITAREKEKTVLLNISNSITAINNKADLLKSISSFLWPIFNYDDACFSIFDKEKKNFTDYYSLYSKGSLQPQLAKYYEVIDSNDFIDSNIYPNAFSAVPCPNSIIDYFMNRPPEMGEMKDVLKLNINTDIINLYLENGLDYYICSPLSVGGNTLGLFTLLFKAQNKPTATSLNLFSQISEIMALAMSNILASEEITESEKEKTVLLSISNSITKINNKIDLLKSINELLLPIFNHNDASFCIVEKDGDYFTDYYNLYSKDLPAPPEPPASTGVIYKMIYKKNEASLLLKNSFVAYAMDRPPAIGKLEDLLDLTIHKELIKSDIEAGLIYYMCAPLIIAGKTIGLFMLDFKEENKPTPAPLDLFAQIAEMMALSISNILSNEEISEREKEKTSLLSISEEISQIRDLDTLVNWLHYKGKVLHNSDHVTIALTSPQNNSVQLILGQADALWQEQSGLHVRKGLINLPTPYKGSIFEYVEALPAGSLFAQSDFKTDLPSAGTFNGSVNLKESFLVKLINKGEPIGHIAFHAFNKGILRNIHSNLCQNFANQIAVSLINILANEDLIEKERQKTFEIQINNAVLKNEEFAGVLEGVASSVNKAIRCDIAYISIKNEDVDLRPFNLFCERNNDVFFIKSMDEVLKEVNVKESMSEQALGKFLGDIKDPVILTGIELDDKMKHNQYLSSFKNKFDIKSFLFVPLVLKNAAIVHLIIGSKKSYAYINSDLEIISRIIPQLSLTLDNRLAFVQIQKLKELVETENLYLQEELNDNYNFNEIIGSSQVLQKVFSQAAMVAGTDTTVLIAGETGTGKELVARAIHNLSKRRDKIMVKVNCACLPPHLVESELFGHEKGSFTGAIDKRIGKFELADGGTIFLDEIGELPLELQSKLLRVIQEREFERIGGKATLKTDIRIIAATNKDLQQESIEKRFRSDLYYRLNVFPILLPALQDRKEDIPLLAMHFAKKFAQKMGKKINAISNEALQEMILYGWPGNVRELEHIIEHSVISSKSHKLTLGRPLLVTKQSAAKALNEFRLKTLDDNERDHILAILQYTKGKVRGIGGAAEILDIHPNTLVSRMLKLGIKKKHQFV